MLNKGEAYEMLKNFMSYTIFQSITNLRLNIISNKIIDLLTLGKKFFIFFNERYITLWHRINKILINYFVYTTLVKDDKKNCFETC